MFTRRLIVNVEVECASETLPITCGDRQIDVKGSVNFGCNSEEKSINYAGKLEINSLTFYPYPEQCIHRRDL
jgi:hypothetical protein